MEQSDSFCSLIKCPLYRGHRYRTEPPVFEVLSLYCDDHGYACGYRRGQWANYENNECAYISADGTLSNTSRVTNRDWKRDEFFLIAAFVHHKFHFGEGKIEQNSAKI